MPDYCTENDLKRYVHYQYLVKLEEIRTGAVAEHMSQVNAEISEALMQGGYPVPEVNTSAILKRIASVVAAWGCIGEITSVMDTEANADNDWIPLQKNYARAMKDLDSIRAGTLDPFPTTESASDSGIQVVSPARIFDEDTWEKF